MDNINLITANQLAEWRGVTPQYIRRLCQAGRIRAQRIGGLWLIDHRVAQEYIEKTERMAQKPIA